jgi:hypothetical protein
MVEVGMECRNQAPVLSSEAPPGAILGMRSQGIKDRH